MLYPTEVVMNYLDMAQVYADQHTDCIKVSVGCALVLHPGTVVFGANRAVNRSCKTNGCMRVEKYGENSKDHRLPADCNAVHSEVDAITRAACQGFSTLCATAFVTRYPCEACARALVAAGVSTVYYGRSQSISDQTEQIFGVNGVQVIHVKKWNRDDTEV